MIGLGRQLRLGLGLRHGRAAGVGAVGLVSARGGVGAPGVVFANQGQQRQIAPTGQSGGLAPGLEPV
ncbi:MAG: hypothetical protein IMF08_17465, partial [Proteobacteria bacterium]|nr:hypothetical protein [Pseudomonadota bacterium]